MKLREKSQVVLVPCEGYEEEKVYEAVKTGLDLLGGIENLLPSDKSILVKTNMLVGAGPEKGITTHPSVFGAVLKCLKQAGCPNLIYGDSPGNPMVKPIESAKKCGFYEQAEKYGATFGAFDEQIKENFEGTNFYLCKAAREADAIIEICKMKTHALENITGAVKNQYGFIYGTHKAEGHALYPSSGSFAKMLVELNRAIGIDLHIMDGIIAMEGNGPASGELTPMKVILMSKDPVALDTTFARLVYLDPALVPTCVEGEKQGLGNMKLENIQVITPDGELTVMGAAEKFGNPNFDVNRNKKSFWGIKGLTNLYRVLIGNKIERPVVDLEKCIGCGLCQKVCPVEGAAVFAGKGQKTRYDYKKCIRCYCCQEMCPEKAIRKKSK